MKENQSQEQQVEHKKGKAPKYKNALDLINRKARRLDTRTKYNNKRQPVNSNMFAMGRWSSLPTFSPRRKKMKGWQRHLVK